ncbi:MAG TPA: hypothetical protein VGI81_01000 [Tepidisphaeraceae bacterium]
MTPPWLGGLGIRVTDTPGDAVMATKIEGGPVTYSYQRVRTVSVHLALLLCATGLPPAGWLLSRRPRRTGRCPTCGYDLRTGKDRCPECYTPIPVNMNA